MTLSFDLNSQALTIQVQPEQVMWLAMLFSKPATVLVYPVVMYLNTGYSDSSKCQPTYQILRIEAVRTLLQQSSPHASHVG